MVVVMEKGASTDQVKAMVERLHEFGFRTHLSEGVERTIIGAIGEKTAATIQLLEVSPGVEKIVPILQPFKLAGREFKQERSLVKAGSCVFGGTHVPVIAGPCAIESEEQFLECAQLVKQYGATMLRGGAYKPRTSPYAFQGLAKEGLRILSEAKRFTGLPVVTEVVNPRDLDDVAEHADMLQIGARNMQNFTLLHEAGLARKPILLKRGLSATVNELLMAAEYIISAGNDQVVLCERGIRTYETETRNTLDLSAIAAIHHLSHLPVIADPSHGTGKWRYVTPMSLAAVAVGADGLLVEVHPRPEEALSDGAQSLRPQVFADMMAKLKPIAAAVGREV
ncbi:MAG TPA: 3-deoxy-7-phosphoheptulonate synthase [Firmicutes bacterium]|jgi:3-deoxy-7-phosphoheptulonate synthase|nr:3-deoxy-7-phosphoheptulonate synthase [Bacillota bacterium]